MKAQALRKIGNWTASAALLAGILYSVLALNTESVYATSCNCAEEQQDAEQFCSATYGGDGLLAYFQCPVDGSYYLFVCEFDNNTPYLFPCD